MVNMAKLGVCVKILFATNFPYLPQRTGGNESSTNDLCNALMKKNIDVAVICTISPYNLLWIKNRIKAKLYNRKFIVDCFLGYPVYRGYNIVNDIHEVVKTYKPDVVVVQAGKPFAIVNALSKYKIPVVLYVRDVFFEKNSEQLQINKYLKCISNSTFTANKLKEKYKIESLILPPLVDSNNYRVNNRGGSVVHIGLSPLKGIDISFELAKRRPDIPFLFVESWPLPRDVFLKYVKKAKILKNVKLKRRCQDMKKIYKCAKVLLVPSVCEEAWGRVVTEAQISGIPVIASNRGGLPESVGNGGIIVPHDAIIDTWEKELSLIWDSEVAYSELSSKALMRSRMCDVSLENNIDIFLDYIKQHIQEIKRDNS